MRTMGLWIWGVAVCWLLIGGAPAHARELLEGDQCTITADQTITGTLFATCRDLTIEGHITGDLYVLAVEALIGGRIDGDLYIAAGRVDITAQIGGSVHFGGGGLDIMPAAVFTAPDASVVSGALSTHLDDTALPGSITAIGYQLLIEGAIGDEVNFWGTALEIGAPVGGEIYAEVGDPLSDGVLELGALLTPLAVSVIDPGLRITNAGDLAGQLTYRSVAAGRIEGDLASEAIFIPYERAITLEQPSDFVQGLRNYLSQVSREFITLGLVGVLTLLLLPRLVQSPLNALRWRPIPSLGVGLIAFLLSFPIFLIMLAISIVLVLLVGLAGLADLTAATAVLLGVVNFSGAGLFYFVAIFISRVIVGLAIGRVIMRWLWKDSPGLRAWLAALGIGLLALALVASLPVVGWIMNAVAAFLGLGSMLTYLQKQLERARDTAIPAAGIQISRDHIPVGAPPLPSDQPRPSLPPPADSPPALDDDPRTTPGMDNLPTGFSWWE